MKTAIGRAILLTRIDHMCGFVHHSTTVALALTNPTLFTLVTKLNPTTNVMTEAGPPHW